MAYVTAKVTEVIKIYLSYTLKNEWYLKKHRYFFLH